MSSMCIILTDMRV